MDGSTVATLCLIGVGLLMLGGYIRRRSLKSRPRRFGPD
jgi:hypothetical protein